MAKETLLSILIEALEGNSVSYLQELNSRLASARLMVWQIVEKKQFAGFKDAKNLVEAYDHLNKAISIFQTYQLPLPLGEKRAKKEKGEKQSILPEVIR